LAASVALHGPKGLVPRRRVWEQSELECGGRLKTYFFEIINLSSYGQTEVVITWILAATKLL
jgi:hypothetical protein